MTVRTAQGMAPMCGPGRLRPALCLLTGVPADSGVKCDCAPRHLGALVLITTGDRRIYASGCTAQVKALIDLWVSRVLVVSAVVQRLGRDSLTFRT